MRAIVQIGEEDVEVQERETPVPADREVLVKVHSAGLCGSDAHAYVHEGGYEWTPIPRVMGHEYSGEVLKVGKAIKEFQPGDKVIEEPVHDCGYCFQCKNGQSNVCQNFSITGMHTDGAFTEFVTVNPAHLHRVPDDVSLRHAAITEPLSIATRAVFTRSRIEPADTVLVEGPGPIGVLVAAVADSMGADVLVSGLERDSTYRLPVIHDLGIETINLAKEDIDERAERFTDGIGFDAVFDTTGHSSGVEQAIRHVRKGGRVIVVGLPGTKSEVFMTEVVRGEVDICSSYGSVWRNFEQALRILESGAVDPDVIIDNSYSISDPAEAFTAFLNSETCKPVFTFADD